MSKGGGDVNFLKSQTCVLKVNIHCDGCKKKVKKLLQKIDGVYTITIDSEQGKVTVSGNVDPDTLVKKLCKAGKHAELLAPKAGNNNNNNKINQLLNGQLQKLQLDQSAGRKGAQEKEGGKAQKNGGGKDQKGQQPQQQQLMKGFKDLKMPQLKDFKFPFQKNPKSVKFNLPHDQDCDDGSEFDGDDDFDDYEEDEDYDSDDIDGFDDDGDGSYDGDLKPLNVVVPPKGNSDKKGGGGGGGGNGKKGGGGDVQVQSKEMGSKKGGAQEIKNNKGAGNGNGNNSNNPAAQKGKTGGGKNDAGNPRMMAGHGFQGMNNAAGAAMGPMGSLPAVQGLPAGAAPQGYFPGGMMGPPDMIPAAANPNYQQQQYMAAMMQLQQQQQQQQQRMGMMTNGQDRPFHPIPYGQPVGYMGPPPPPPPSNGEPYAHFFSDENTNSCSVM